MKSVVKNKNSEESVGVASGKRILGWLLKGLGVAAALWLVFILTGRVLRPIAVAQIAELTNTKINVESIDFNLNGSVFIRKLVIRPHQEPKYDNAILKAETVYARFGIGSLLLLKPRLKEIIVNDFIFNAQHDLDADRWNVAALKIGVPAGGSGKMPLVNLERGTLQYSKVSNGRVKVVATVPLDITFAPDGKNPHACIFSITTAKRPGLSEGILAGSWQPGRITIAGGISLADFPVFGRTWAMNVLDAELNYDTSTYSLKVKIKDLLGKHTSAGDIFASDRPLFLEKFGPFNTLQKFFNRYRPAGRVDIDLQALGNLHQLTDSTLRGKVHCKDVSICNRRFPYPVEHLAGQIDFTEKSFSLNNLYGRHGNVKLFFNGWSKDFGPNRKYQFRITSDNMTLDNDLYNALSKKQKKSWSAFSPSGLAAIDYRLSRWPQTNKKKILAVELLDAQAVYRHFPYPLKNLTGSLLFDHDSVIASDVVSQVNGRKITLNGKVTACRTDRPICDISLRAEDIPLDSILAASLPAEQRNFYNQFCMVGLADADVKIFTPEQDLSPTSFIADVHFKKTSLKVSILQTDPIPPAISDISAKVVFTPGLILIENFTGRYSQSLVSLTGRIWPGKQEQLRYCLLLHAGQTELNDDLIAVMPVPLAKIVSKLQPKGKINLSANLNKAASDDCSEHRITVDCLGNSVNFELLPYPLKDITGRLTITKNDIQFEGITATAADNMPIISNASTIKINGRIALADNASSSDRLQLSAGDITLMADNLRIKGKSLTGLKANFCYEHTRRNWMTKYLIADCYGGRLAGKFELKQTHEADLEYLLHVGFDNIDLKQFLSDTNSQGAHRNSYTTGKMSGSLSIATAVGESLPRIGRCRLQITDMQVGKLSPLTKLLQLKLTESEQFAFDRIIVDSYIKNNKLFFKHVDLAGKDLAFNGSGWMDLQTLDINLVLFARGHHRLATAQPSVLQSLAEGLGIAVVRMEVTGNFYDPKVETRALPVIEDSLGILGTPR